MNCGARVMTKAVPEDLRHGIRVPCQARIDARLIFQSISLSFPYCFRDTFKYINVDINNHLAVAFPFYGAVSIIFFILIPL
jgi:hypothetical protein